MKRLPEALFARGDAQGFSNPSKSRVPRTGHSPAFRAGIGGLRAFYGANAQGGFGDMLHVPSLLLSPTLTCSSPFLLPGHGSDTCVLPGSVGHPAQAAAS